MPEQGNAQLWNEMLDAVCRRRVALVHCADPRVFRSLYRNTEGLLASLEMRASHISPIVNEGAGWQFSPTNGLADAAFRINRHILHVSDVVVVAGHGDCAKYEGNDHHALTDIRRAAKELSERLGGKQVFLLWQQDPNDATEAGFSALSY